MDTFEADAVVIGAGAVGLSCARALALKGREVLVLEAAGAIATETVVQSTTPARTLGQLERHGLGEYFMGGTGFTGQPPKNSTRGGEGLLVVEDRFPMYISATVRNTDGFAICS